MAGIIKNVFAREVINRKGYPTVEVDVLLDDGSLGRATAPGGTSRGLNEPVDLRDGDEAYFDGMGVNQAILNAKTEIADRLRGRKAVDQEAIDGLLIELDGTEDLSRLGSNAIVATSLANAKAAAASLGIQLFEHLGGGEEIPLSFVYVMFAGPAYVGLEGICDFQEFALIPLFATSYKEGYLATLGIYERLGEIIAKRTGLGIPNLKGIAGDLTANFDSNDEALATLTRLIEEAGYVPRKDFGIYLDIAASQLYRDGKYHLEADNRVLSTDEMIDRLEEMCNTFPVISMEDCLFEDDWEGWRKLTERLGSKVQLVGDDLFVTNPKRLTKGLEMGVANAVMIKPNQVGTLTKTFETISIAKAAGYGTIISPRSGEIWDPYIAHLCVGQNLGQGKIVGAYSGGERNLNELSRIKDHLGKRAVYRGKEVLSRFL
jgi:enolase